MKNWILAFFCFVASLFSSSENWARNKSQAKTKDQPQGKEVKLEEKLIILNKAQITQKLTALKSKPVPKNLSEGAMCYKVASPPDRIEYICPVCHNKTIYTQGQAHFIARDLPQIRSQIQTLKKFGITLDESQFCGKCSKIMEKPEACILIPYQDEKQAVKTCAINATDITLLREFLEDKVVHSGSTEFETPLKDFIDRLEQLLGLKTKK
jgi:hypothetical protein